MTAKYMVYFRVPIENALMEYRTTVATSIGIVAEGFWINDNFEFTVSGDNTRWIPPSQILGIEKVDE